MSERAAIALLKDALSFELLRSSNFDIVRDGETFE